MLNRRVLLRGGLAAAAATLSSPALAGTDYKLHLLRERTGEVFHGVYIRDTFFGGPKVDPDALPEIDWILRDILTDATRRMDPDLLLLALRIQVRTGGAPLVVTSAFRTESTNARVGGAPQSRHITAQALDIKIAGKSTTDIAAIAREAGAGGVGRYPRRGFVHVDTGMRRDWVG